MLLVSFVDLMYVFLCSFMLDHEEACLVREQAAILLTNVSGHSAGGATLSLCPVPLNSTEVRQFVS
jgi:hypothetical protein